jgi:3-dehydroquinate synthase
MAYSATLANMRGTLSNDEHKRLLNLFSRAGLSMDHHQFDEEILNKATQAILRTRDGKLRAAVPSPLGSCVFLNDVEMSEMYEALRRHKIVMRSYPRQGEGIEAFVDSSDTGYTMNDEPVETEEVTGITNGLSELNPLKNGVGPDHNGNLVLSAATSNGVPVQRTVAAKGINTESKCASGLQNRTTHGINGHMQSKVDTNGVVNGAH